jgi:hypothetical protein
LWAEEAAGEVEEYLGVPGISILVLVCTRGIEKGRRKIVG